MAIKINGQDMARRVINNKDVQRVILNGQQIRPYATPQINYHIINNFSGGGGTYPGGWTPGGGSAYIGGDGIYSGGGEAHFDYNGFPDLSHAVRVEIIYHTTIDINSLTTNNIYGRFYYGNGQNVGLGSYLGKSFNDEKYVLWLKHGQYGQGHEIDDGLTSGTYTFNWNIYLNAGRNTWNIVDGSDTELAINTRSISSELISNLRSANNFDVMLQPGIVVSSIDFYVYNGDAAPWGAGWHISSSEDFEKLGGFTQDLGLNIQYEDYMYYLSMPPCGWLNPIGDRRGYNEVERRFRTTHTRGRPGTFWEAAFRGPGEGWISNGGSNTDPGYACPIRLFKDTPVVPDENWYTQINLHGGRTRLCHNYQQGLISFTYNNGRNWYTMADKNRGATELWTQGGEPTLANSGYYFQRGNNHGFTYPITDYVNTPVDVTGYGNGIYYDSRNFGKGSYQYDGVWFSPLDTPLRP